MVKFGFKSRHQNQIRLVAMTLLVSALIGMSGLGTQAQETPPATEIQATPPATPVSPSPPQPSYDAIRLQQDGAAFSYAVWLSWAPQIVFTPDGGAWAFFSAAPLRSPDGQIAEAAGDRGRLYASRFDPTTRVWAPGQPMPGGEIQFGPAAVVTPDGTVHIVYSDRARDAADAFSTLVYTRSDGNGGWTELTPVAADPNAGHQLAAAIALDGNGQIHAVWQDQRNVEAEAQAAAAANADIFASDLTDGTWSEPVQISARPTPDAYASRPQLLVDGDRLIAIWSIYDAATGTNSASRVDWSTRPLDNPDEWTEPATLLERGDSQMGGRLLDVAANPQGGLVMVFGRRGQAGTTLFLKRLDPGADAWSEDITLASGDRGSFPTLAVAADGTTHITYEIGSGTKVQVGTLTVPPGGAQASPELILTVGQEGSQGRPVIALDPAGAPWVLYAHETSGSALATEMHCIRQARLTPTTT